MGPAPTGGPRKSKTGLSILWLTSSLSLKHRQHHPNTLLGRRKLRKSLGTKTFSQRTHKTGSHRKAGSHVNKRQLVIATDLLHFSEEDRDEKLYNLPAFIMVFTCAVSLHRMLSPIPPYEALPLSRPAPMATLWSLPLPGHFTVQPAGYLGWSLCTTNQDLSSLSL